MNSRNEIITGIDHHKYIFLVNNIDRYYSFEHLIDHVNRNIYHHNNIYLKENI